MAVQVAAHIRDLDQLRKLGGRRGLDLAVSLTELGLDVVEPNPPVDLGLGRVALHVLGLDLADPVIGDRQTHPDRPLAQLDVVARRAGEVLEQVAVGVRGDDPQVDRDPVVGRDPSAGLANGRRGGDHRMLGERSGEGDRVGRGRDQVDVLAGLPPAAHRPGDLDCVGGRVSAQRLGELLGDGEHRGEDQPLLGSLLTELVECGQDALLGLLTESLDHPDPFLLGGGPQVVEVGDAELVEQPSGRLRADPGDPGHIDERRRELCLQLRRRRDLAGLDQGDDLLLKRLADSWQFGGPALGGELGNRQRALADHARRLVVGEHAVPDGAVELIQRPQLREGVGDLGVPHRR